MQIQRKQLHVGTYNKKRCSENFKWASYWSSNK